MNAGSDPRPFLPGFIPTGSNSNRGSIASQASHFMASRYFGSDALRLQPTTANTLACRHRVPDGGLNELARRPTVSPTGPATRNVVGYRFFATADADFDGTKAGYDSHSIEAGIRYRF